MSKYNECFTTIIDRTGTDSVATSPNAIAGFMKGASIKEGFSPIAMWIADMSFATVPTITEAIAQRLTHPIFGYFPPKEEYANKIVQWQTERHGAIDLTPECVGYENGVLGGVVSTINVLCSRGDKILLHSPTYVGFTKSLENCGYDLIHSPLVLDEEGIWRMDFEDMEEKLKTQHIHTAILCSPHNPIGRVWERWELEKAMELYKKYNVYVLSDEIWADITLGDYQHIPTQCVSEDARNRTVALYAPSKTFNLAGLIGSYHIIYNQYLRDRIRKEASLCHYNSMNVLSMHALLGAYTPEGREWLDELRQVLTTNIDYGYEFFTTKVKGVSLAKPQGTYMLFLDCTKWCEEHGKTIDELLQLGFAHGVIWQDGRAFHGNCSIRMNLALPYAQLAVALDRLDKYVFNA